MWAPNEPYDEETSSVSDVEPGKIAAYARRWKRFTRSNHRDSYRYPQKGKGYHRASWDYNYESKDRTKNKGKHGDKNGHKKQDGKGKPPYKGKMSYLACGGYDEAELNADGAIQAWGSGTQARDTPSCHESS